MAYRTISFLVLYAVHGAPGSIGGTAGDGGPIGETAGDGLGKGLTKVIVEAERTGKDPRTGDVVKGVGKGAANVAGKGMSAIMEMHPDLPKAAKGAGKGLVQADAVAKGVGKDLDKLASEADRASMDPRTGDVVKGVGKGVAKIVGKGMSKEVSMDPDLGKAVKGVGKGLMKAAPVAKGLGKDLDKLAVEADSTVKDARTGEVVKGVGKGVAKVAEKGASNILEMHPDLPKAAKGAGKGLAQADSAAHRFAESFRDVVEETNNELQYPARDRYGRPIPEDMSTVDMSLHHFLAKAANGAGNTFVHADAAARGLDNDLDKLAVEADSMVKDPRTGDVVKGAGKGVANVVGKGMSEEMSTHPDLVKAVKGAGKGLMKADAVAKGVGKDVDGLANEADRASLDPRTGDVVKGVGKGVAKVVGKGMSKEMSTHPDLGKAVKGAGKGLMKADAVAKGVGKDLDKLAVDVDSTVKDPRTGDVVKGVGKGVAKVAGKGMSKILEMHPNLAKAGNEAGRSLVQADAAAKGMAKKPEVVDAMSAVDGEVATMGGANKKAVAISGTLGVVFFVCLVVSSFAAYYFEKRRVPVLGAPLLG